MRAIVTWSKLNPSCWLCTQALVIFCIGFTRHYQDKHESELFATIVTILGLSLLFATLALVPVDIFLVSSTVDYSTGLKKDWANPDTVYWMTLTIQIIYYSTC